MNTKSKILGLLTILALLYTARTEAHNSSFTEKTRLEVYSSSDHGGGAISTKITQSNNGIVYVANENGVLRFDGEQWRKMPKTGYATYTSSVSVDPENRVWCVGPRHVGYYYPNDSGQYVFEDLTKSLRESTEWTSEVLWDVITHDQEVYLISSNHVFILKNESWISWKFAEERRILPTLYKDNLYIYARGTGLFSVSANRSALIAIESDTVASGIIGITSNPQGEAVFTTVSNGFFTMERGKFMRPTTETVNYDTITIEQLQTGTVVIGTINDGILFLDKNHQKKRVIPKIEESHYDILEHSSGDIWIATTKNIIRIKNPNITHLNSAASSLVQVQKDIFLSDDNSLRRISPSTHTRDSEDIKIHEGQALWALQEHKGELLFGDYSSLNIRDQRGETTRIPHKRHITLIRPSWHDKYLIYTSDPPTISRWLKNLNGWQYLDSLETYSSGAQSLVEMPDKRLLISTGNSPIQIASWASPRNSEITKASLANLGEEHGLPESFIWAHCLRHKDNILLVTDKGLFEYDIDLGKFHYNDLLGDNLGNDAYGFESCNLARGAGFIIRIPKFPDGNQNENLVGILKIVEDGTVEWHPLLLPSLSKVGKVEALLHRYTDGSEFIWVGGSKDTFRYNLSSLNEPPLLDILFSKIEETTLHQKHFGGAGTPLQNQRWDFPQKSLRFEYATPPSSIDLEGYQSRMIGFEDDWTEVSQLRFRDFTNLSEGKYTFEVRAIDEFGRPGEIKRFHFVLLPPWYRTIYANIGYALVIILLGGGISRWRTAQLKRKNTELEYAVSERTTELNRQKLELIEANSVKENFLASMSHEIRNPLNGILGITQLMKKKSGQNKQDDIQIAHLFSCANHLHQLLGQVLDYSSLEAGKIVPEQIPFTPSGLVKDVADMHRILANDKGLELINNELTSSHQWIGDPTLLRQVLINLVSNAIKYTPEGSVTLKTFYRIEDFSVYATFEVTDTGPGIPKGKRSFIFEKFTRLKDEGENTISGTGLGLAIASDLANLMGGKLELCEDYHHGAKFRLTVTFGQGAPIKISSAENETVSDQLLENRSVLIADDMEFNRYVCMELLKSVGAKVDAVNDGIEAIEKLKNNEYEVAILDINMPGANGIEVVQAIRQENREKNPLFIALSAHTSTKFREECISTGFDEFIIKPLDSEKLSKLFLKSHAATSNQEKESTGLIDELFSQSSEKKTELNKRLLASILEELENLEKAIQEQDPKGRDHFLHRLKGLCAFYKDSDAKEALDNVLPLAKNMQSIQSYIEEFKKHTE